MAYKETFYFQHDYEPVSDPKITALLGKHGAAGYGIFWRIVEMLHSNTEHKLPKKEYIYAAIAQQMLTSVEQISTIIEYATNVCELFLKDENYIISERVNRNFDKRNDISEKRSAAGKLSASIRYNKSSTNANTCSTKTNKGKEKKRKENNTRAREVPPYGDIKPKPGMVF